MRKPRSKHLPKTVVASQSSSTVQTADISSSRTHARIGLIEARIRKHLSQQALADLLGTTHITVNRWESGFHSRHQR